MNSEKTDHAAIKNNSSSSYFDALDLLRGVAALAVFFYHSSGLFFGTNYKLLPSAYLCVDLFFMLSGFVIAANYDKKICQGMPLRIFLVQRMARLYPLFILATLLGFPLCLAQQFNNTGHLQISESLVSLLVNIFFVPVFFKSSAPLFPFNGPSWSIFYEIFVNLLYFIFWKWLSNNRMLVAVIVFSGFGLAIGTFQYGSVCMGWRTDTLWWGFPRVVFSFALGAFLFRLRLHEKLRLGSKTACCCLVALALSSSARDFLQDGKVYMLAELGLIAIFFPILVTTMSCVTLGERGKYHAKNLGGSSYAIYLLQNSAILFMAGVSSFIFNSNIVETSPWSGILLAPVFIFLSHKIWLHYEIPAKNWLRCKFLNPS